MTNPDVLELNAAAQEPAAWVIPGDDNARADGFLDAMAFKNGEFTRPLYAAPQAPAIPLKERPDFIEGYHAGLKDGRACAERDAPDVLALLREARECIDALRVGEVPGDTDFIVAQIDAMLKGTDKQVLGRAEVWHEGSKSFYNALLLEKIDGPTIYP